jgi:hypothetical protein
MMFVGLFVLRSRTGVSLFSTEELEDTLSGPTRFNSIRKLSLFVTFLAIFNFLVVAVCAYNGFHYSESVAFCAELCHGVMAPERTAYRSSPHSRVECVNCHIGEGATWFVRSKVSGMRQLAAVALDTFSRPIETPIHGLRPARETCEECHRPELFHGERLRVKDSFLDDETNTHVRTVLLMKVGSGDHEDREPEGSHWHVSSRKRIVYAHTDRKRREITEVRLIEGDGRETVFASDAPQAPDTGETVHAGTREMDCLDCHNRPTHVYSTADEALDRRLLHGQIPRELPWVKRQAMEVITGDYETQESGVAEIASRLRTWYADNYPEIVERDPDLVERAIGGVSRAYAENVFPDMKVGFGTYERVMGHVDDGGCFRCHDETHQTADGRVISQDCELCHRVLAVEEPVVDGTLPGLSASAVAQIVETSRSE